MLPENYTGYGVHEASSSTSLPSWFVFVFVIDGDIVDRADDDRGRWTGEPGGAAGFYNPIKGVPDIGRSPKDTRTQSPEPGYYGPYGDGNIRYFDGRNHRWFGYADARQPWSEQPCFMSTPTQKAVQLLSSAPRLGVDPPAGCARCPIDPLFTEPEAVASKPTPTPEPPEAKPVMSDLTPSTAIVECTYDTLPLGALFQYVNGDPDTVYQKVHLSVGTGGMDDAQRKRAVLVSCKPGGRWPIGTVFPSTNTDTRRVVPVLSHLQVWR